MPESGECIGLISLTHTHLLFLGGLAELRRHRDGCIQVCVFWACISILMHVNVMHVRASLH